MKVTRSHKGQRSLTTEQLVAGILTIFRPSHICISLQGHSSLCRSCQGHTRVTRSKVTHHITARRRRRHNYLAHYISVLLQYTINKVTCHYIGQVKVKWRSLKGQIKVTHHRAVRHYPHNYLSRHTFVPLQCTHLQGHRSLYRSGRGQMKVTRSLKGQRSLTTEQLVAGVSTIIPPVTHLFHFNAHIVVALIFARFTISDGFRGTIFFVTYKIKGFIISQWYMAEFLTLWPSKFIQVLPGARIFPCSSPINNHYLDHVKVIRDTSLTTGGGTKESGKFYPRNFAIPPIE